MDFLNLTKCNKFVASKHSPDSCLKPIKAHVALKYRKQGHEHIHFSYQIEGVNEEMKQKNILMNWILHILNKTVLIR